MTMTAQGTVTRPPRRSLWDRYSLRRQIIRTRWRLIRRVFRGQPMVIVKGSAHLVDVEIHGGLFAVKGAEFTFNDCWFKDWLTPYAAWVEVDGLREPIEERR